MKLRRMMAVVGGLAVACWLVAPAVRLGLDPSLRHHRHVLQSEIPGRKLTFQVGSTAADFDRLVFSHVGSFSDRYFELLLGRSVESVSPCRQWDDHRRMFCPNGSATREISTRETLVIPPTLPQDAGGWINFENQDRLPPEVTR